MFEKRERDRFGNVDKVVVVDEVIDLKRIRICDKSGFVLLKCCFWN